METPTETGGNPVTTIVEPDVVNLVVVDEWKKEVLLIERAKGKSGEGLFAFPGGKIDPGESPERALAREIYEELGVCLNPHVFEFLADEVSENGKRPRFFTIHEPPLNFLREKLECNPEEVASTHMLTFDKAIDFMAFSCHRRILEALNL